MYTKLNAAELGVATARIRLIMIAVAPGLPFPSWPEYTHYNPDWEWTDEQIGDLVPFVTVEDAIRDLEWRNPRVDVYKSNRDKLGIYCAIPQDKERPLPSAYALSLGALNQGTVTHHMTGKEADSRWNSDVAVGSYYQPLNSECPSAFLISQTFALIHLIF